MKRLPAILAIALLPIAIGTYVVAQPTDGFLNQGTEFLENHEPEKAVIALRLSVKNNPKSARAHQALGLALAITGKPAEGIKELQAAIELDPQLPESRVTLGAIYQSLGKSQNAVKTYSEFLHQFPDCPTYQAIANLRESLERELEQPDAQDHTSPWKRAPMPLRVCIHGGEADNDNILHQAFDDWSNASGGAVKFSFVKDPGEANIECIWTDRSTQSPSIDAGICEFTREDGVTPKCRLSLSTKMWSPYLPPTANRIRLICLHEIGHALGLQRHSINPNDVMFYSMSLDNRYRDISPADSKRLRSLL